MSATSLPFGDDASEPSPEHVLGVPKGPIEIPEDRLQEGGKFAFQGEVAEKFEQEVISTQIPGYENMRQRTARVILEFLKPETGLIDIGTSTGRTIRDIISVLATRKDTRFSNSYFYGMDYEQDMIDQARAKMDDFRQSPAIKEAIEGLRLNSILDVDESVPHVDFTRGDLRQGLRTTGGVPASVITSVLTLQFIPVDYRSRAVRDIYNKLVPGGAFVFIEKVFNPNAQLDDLLNKMYYEFKSLNGISTDAIFKKRQNLENVLIPFTTEGNLELLRGAGFRKENIVTYWRDIQFEAYVAIKD